MTKNRPVWQLNLGATVLPQGVQFRVWAPKCQQVEVGTEGQKMSLTSLSPEEEGYFSGIVPQIGAGTRYRYRLDNGESYPDPCSRFQPEGPHGPSVVIDSAAYRWQDSGWSGARITGQVLYEMHVGTFTPEGTFDAAAQELAELQRCGMTMIEVMPIAECPGRWNWGYDGVDMYAPSHNYGDAEAFKRFVDTAHTLGISVILDVVYNHLGPDGNYLRAYSNEYFTDRYENDWGDAINFDGPGSEEVREFFLQNACYWISEFHLDGLRLDATQNIYDAGPVHILAELSRRTREVALPRQIVLIAENEPQDARYLLPLEQGGFDLDGMWNDDFHHAAQVAFTGRREAYYTDYRGEPQEFISTVKRGFLYQGQRYKWQKQPRGTAVTTQPASGFVFFTQNHDQVANSLHGERIHALTSPARYRALTALMLLAPGTPLFLMGQEFGASSPFLFFADHRKEVLAKDVYRGRKEFLAQFPSYGSPGAQEQVPLPDSASSFEQSKLKFSERQTHADIYCFHQELLRVRREDVVIAAQARERLDGAVLSSQALVLRFFGQQTGNDRLLVVNVGPDLEYSPAPEPLLAPSREGPWQLIWSSDDPRYGGPGIINPLSEEGWRLPGASAALFSTAFSSRDTHG